MAEPSSRSGSVTARAEDRGFATMFLVACDALLRISKGSSERDAVARSWANKRDTVGSKKAVLNLVLRTVDQQDLLDGLVRRVFPNRRFGGETQCLLRLAALIITGRIGRVRTKNLEHNLRNILSPELVTIVEVLMGTLPEMEESSFLSSLSDISRVSIEAHYPPWWVEYCFRLFGRGEAMDLLSSMGRMRYVRVNSLRNRGRTSLPKSGLDWSSILERTTEPAVYVLKVSPSSLADYFSKGLFQLQDLASFLAVRAADPRPQEKLLDLCAAPGAKTSAAAQLMRNKGRIVSVDYSPRRMRSWARETKRLGVTIAEAIIADATSLSLNERFDLAIVDPPCTGTGVLDRNPSMKWRLSDKSLQRLTILQRQMLESAASMVAPKGRIVYSTCSVTEEENELVISEFLRNHPDFETTPANVGLGSPGIRGFSDCRRFYPHRDKTAGYFIARMDRLN